MILAFHIDQVQESFCRVFDEIRQHYKSNQNLWERLRADLMTVTAFDWEGGMRLAWVHRTSLKNLVNFDIFWQDTWQA